MGHRGWNDARRHSRRGEYGYGPSCPEQTAIQELGFERTQLHCPSPVIRPVGDELWVAGRVFGKQLPSSMIPPEPPKEKIEALARLDERLAKPQEWHVALWRLVGDRFEPILVLPSRGDNAYPGMVVETGRVLVSYHSQHDVDEGPKPKPGEHASEIYLAEIGL